MYCFLKSLCCLDCVTIPSLATVISVVVLALLLQHTTLCHTATRLYALCMEPCLQPLGNTEVVSAEIDERSLYVAPFPMDVNLDKVRSPFFPYPSYSLAARTQYAQTNTNAHTDVRSLAQPARAHLLHCAQLTEFFLQHAPVNCVRLRRHVASKTFRGSIFVEFGSVADAEKVRSVVFPGGQLIQGGRTAGSKRSADAHTPTHAHPLPLCPPLSSLLSTGLLGSHETLMLKTLT